MFSWYSAKLIVNIIGIYYEWFVEVWEIEESILWYNLLHLLKYLAFSFNLTPLSNLLNDDTWCALMWSSSWYNNNNPTNPLSSFSVKDSFIWRAGFTFFACEQVHSMISMYLRDSTSFAAKWDLLILTCRSFAYICPKICLTVAIHSLYEHKIISQKYH